MKLGGTIVKSYLQRMSSAVVADRVSLLAHREFVGFYTKLGFEDEGLSSSELYGGGWVNMVCHFSFLALFDRSLDPLSHPEKLDGFDFGATGVIHLLPLHLNTCADVEVYEGFALFLLVLPLHYIINDLYTGIPPFLLSQPTSHLAVLPRKRFLHN